MHPQDIVSLPLFSTCTGECALLRSINEANDIASNYHTFCN